MKPILFAIGAAALTVLPACGGPPCVPQQQTDCPCEDGAKGVQACLADGSGYEPCSCSTSDTQGSGGTLSGSTTSSAGGAGGSTGSTSGGGGGGGSGGTGGGVPAKKAIGVCAGDAFSCAVLDDNTARCWGYNGTGQLGRGTPPGGAWPPGPVEGLNDAVSITCGDFHACAVHQNGEVSCWGFGPFLGNGDNNSQAAPVKVPSLETVDSVSASGWLTCAHRSDGTVACWGSTVDPSTGYYSATGPILEPVTVAGLVNTERVSVGDEATRCASGAQGVYCWGHNEGGQAGVTPPPTEVIEPTKLTGNFSFSDVKGISAGVASCVITSTTAWCWGADLGYAPKVLSADTVAIDSGGLKGNVCGVGSNHKVWCRGSNDWGQLGNGTILDQIVADPVAVSGLPPAEFVSVGWDHACAVTTDAAVYCWGNNDSGQLGAIVEQMCMVGGKTASCSPIPVQVIMP